MSEVIQSSRVVHWLREVVHQRGEPRGEGEAPARAIRVIEEGLLFIMVTECLAQLLMAWRHSVVYGLLEFILHQIRMLQLWQRVRLLGWTCFVAVLTYRLLVGIGDFFTYPVALVIFSGLLVLAVGMMWGCRAVACAWVHRTGARSGVRRAQPC